MRFSKEPGSFSRVSASANASAGIQRITAIMTGTMMTNDLSASLYQARLPTSPDFRRRRLATKASTRPSKRPTAWLAVIASAPSTTHWTSAESPPSAASAKPCGIASAKSAMSRADRRSIDSYRRRRCHSSFNSNEARSSPASRKSFNKRLNLFRSSSIGK
jgi:hypothetical protein